MADGTGGLDIGSWLVYVGMMIGGAAAGFAARSGWKSGGSIPPERELAVSGQAFITDLGPVRDLVKQAELLAPSMASTASAMAAVAQQQARTSAAIERLVGIVEEYIEAQQTDRDNEEEIERRVADRLSDANQEEVRRQVKVINARNTRARAARRKEKPTG